MKPDRRWGIPLFVTLGALFIYFTFPLLVQGMNSLIKFIIGGIFILLALPQMLWWGVGVTILIFWGLRVLMNLEISRLSKSGKREGQPYDYDYHGRFRVIRQRLLGASSRRYSQDEVRNILRSLAIELIALKLDISEEEARQRFRQGDWTEDRALEAYFLPEPHRGKEKQGLWRRFKRTKSPAFLEETQEALDRLKSYRNFSEGRKRFDLANHNN
jgi:hypothetical protein